MIENIGYTVIALMFGAQLTYSVWWLFFSKESVFKTAKMNAKNFKNAHSTKALNSKIEKYKSPMTETSILEVKPQTPPCIAGEIRTYTGQMVNVLKPDLTKICIEDIAHALAVMPRFCGHTNKIYTVAEHSIRVAGLLPPELQMAGLLHDASEAYMCDIPTPIKILLPDYYTVENGLMHAIARKFGFEWPLHPEVVKADKTLLEMEWDVLMDTDTGNFEWGNLHGKRASRMFLKYFDNYSQ